jgi:hypothetical protein
MLQIRIRRGYLQEFFKNVLQGYDTNNFPIFIIRKMVETIWFSVIFLALLVGILLIVISSMVTMPRKLVNVDDIV